MGNTSSHINRTVPESSDSYLTANRENRHEAKSNGALVFSSLTHHKGLSNPLGGNHCFLNSTIQILWHTGAFRSQLAHLIAQQRGLKRSKDSLMLGMEDANVDSKNSSTFDSVLVSPVLSSDDDFHMDINPSPSSPSTGSEDKAVDVAVAASTVDKDDGFVYIQRTSTRTAAGDSSSSGTDSGSDSGIGIIDALCNLFAQYEQSHKTVLPPDELRVALSEVNTQFGLGSIADANEALLAILGRIHDESASTCPTQSRCLSHFILGGAVMEQAFCPLCYATSEPTVWESFVHHFSAADLVQCAIQRGKRQNKVSFGRLLRDAMGVQAKSCPSESDPPPRPDAPCTSKANVKLFCLEAPLALAVAPTWHSSTESASMLSDFYGLVSRRIRLNDMFFVPNSHSQEQGALDSSVSVSGSCSGSGSDSASSSSGSSSVGGGGPTYLLRGFVAYYGCHYVSIVNEHEDVNNYLLCDDYCVRSIGPWEKVVRMSVRAKYQPVLLIYELLVASANAGGNGNGDRGEASSGGVGPSSGSASANSPAPTAVASAPVLGGSSPLQAQSKGKEKHPLTLPECDSTAKAASVAVAVVAADDSGSDSKESHSHSYQHRANPTATAVTAAEQSSSRAAAALPRLGRPLPLPQAPSASASTSAHVPARVPLRAAAKAEAEAEAEAGDVSISQGRGYMQNKDKEEGKERGRDENEDETAALRLALGLPLPKQQSDSNSDSNSDSIRDRRGPAPALQLAAIPLVYEVRLEAEPSSYGKTYGFTPLVRGDGSVLICELNRTDAPGNSSKSSSIMLPAERAGVALLDELLTINGRTVCCRTEEEVKPLFSYPAVTLRLRSSYRQTLCFACPSCTNESAITSVDIERVRNQVNRGAAGEGKGSSVLMCEACDLQHTVLSADLQDIDCAIVKYLGHS